MICLKGIYDSSSKRLIIEYKTCLLVDNFSDLENSFNKYKRAGFLPKDLELLMNGESKCAIIIPIDLPESSNAKDGEPVSGVPKELTEKLAMALDDFRESVMKREFKTTEWIPLTGYPLKNLQTDIRNAIKNKRNFRILDKYSEYLKFSRGKTTKINQSKKILFCDDEYSEVALSIYEGDMNGLRNKYLPLLEETEWE